VESVESPAKRAKVAQGADVPHAPYAASTTKAEFPRNVAIKEISLEKTRCKAGRVCTGKLAHQSLVAGAPSPCRAVRLGPMPSAPPKQPPPQTSKPPGYSHAPEALQVRADQNFHKAQEEVFPDQATTKETQIAFTSGSAGTANNRSNNAGDAVSLKTLPGCTGFAVPAAFAQRSNVDHGTIEEESLSPHSPPAVASAGWQASALFAPPPPSPDHTGLTPDPLGFASVSRSGAFHPFSLSSPTNPLVSLVPVEPETARTKKQRGPVSFTWEEACKLRECPQEGKPRNRDTATSNPDHSFSEDHDV